MTDDFFKFEEKEYDFPFYNGIPKLSKKGWIAFLFVPISFILVFLGIPYYVLPIMRHVPMEAYQLLFFILPFIFLVYACKGKLGLFFKKPKLKDFKVIVICFVLYYIYGGTIALILIFNGLDLASNPVLNPSSGTINFIQIIATVIQLLGEEFFKVSLLILGMALLYHFTKNRKWALVFGSAISMTIFGLAHFGAYGNIIHCLLIIGVGSVFHIYPYIKTKNIVNTYILHILIDFVPLLLLLLPFD